MKSVSFWYLYIRNAAFFEYGVQRIDIGFRAADDQQFCVVAVKCRVSANIRKCGQLELRVIYVALTAALLAQLVCLTYGIELCVACIGTGIITSM